MPRKTASLCLPLHDWPDADHTLWRHGLHAGGLFDDVGAGANWAPASRRKTASGYGRWLTWLMSKGFFDPAICPARRVTPDRVAAYVRDLGATVSSVTLVCRVQELRDALRVLAPGDDWAWLDGIYRTVRTRATPVRDKQVRLRSAGDLVACGTAMMAAASCPGWSARRRAVHYRDGLMIALLAYRPVRLKNFAAMRLGLHLLDHGRGFGISIPAAETKNKVAYDTEVPEALVRCLQHYLGVHRPILLAGEQGAPPSNTTDAVWVSETGTQLESSPLASRIRKHTNAAFGRSVPPHWFRDAAATTIAIENPAHVRDAHLVLGHAGLGTTERHYNQARSVQASRRYMDVLAGLTGPRRVREGSEGQV